MGMPIAIDVRDPIVVPDAIRRASVWLRWVDATFSTSKADSAVSQLNRSERALAAASPAVHAVCKIR